MNKREKVSEILKKVKPIVDLTSVNDIIDGEYLESLDFMNLVTELNDAFGIEIDVDDITPENFNSIDAMIALVDRLQK